MSSADSRRVETDERRWWWEAGRSGESAGAEEDNGMELRERERRWAWRAKEWRLCGGTAPPILKE
jgi:hypothetical protein